MRESWRIALVFCVLAACASAVGFLFWKQELQYQLPTPRPIGYQPVATGTSLQLDGLNRHFSDGALFIHFYNPDCPCSRFNASHIKKLVRLYSDSVKVIVVVPNEGALAQARKIWGSDLVYIDDSDGEIAHRTGVYSTPQAVIVDSNGNLFYRGNYNRARYCTAKATNFAELALLALLNNQPPPLFAEEATVAYGCSLHQPLLLSLD